MQIFYYVFTYYHSEYTVKRCLAIEHLIPMTDITLNTFRIETC